MKALAVGLAAALAAALPCLATAAPADIRRMATEAEAAVNKGDYERASQLALRALELARAAKPADREGVALALAPACSSIASVDFQKGVPYCEENLAVRRRLWGEGDPRVLEAAKFMAQINMILGKLPDALTGYEQVIAGYEALPATPRRLADTADTRCNYGLALFSSGRWTEAEQNLRQGIGLFSRANLESDINPWAECQTYLADRLMRTGRYLEAEPVLRQTVQFRDARLPGHPGTADTLGVYGDLLMRLGRYGEAEPLLRRAIAIAEREAVTPKATLARALQNLGRLYVASGRPELGLPLQERAIRTVESIGPAGRNMAATVHLDLANASAALGDLDQARRHTEQALELSKAAGVSPTDPGEILLLRARVEFAAGAIEAAEARAKEGYEILNSAMGERSARVAAARALLARAASARAAHAEARELYAQAAKDLEAAGVRDRVLAHTKAGLAEATLSAGGAKSEAWKHADAGADLLTERVSADARAPGRSLDAVVSEEDRRAYRTALKAGWRYAEELTAQQ